MKKYLEVDDMVYRRDVFRGQLMSFRIEKVTKTLAFTVTGRKLSREITHGEIPYCMEIGRSQKPFMVETEALRNEYQKQYISEYLSKRVDWSTLDIETLQKVMDLINPKK